MKIKNITIKNFRGIDSLSLDFTHPAGKPLDLVVLAGPNGCGKTSVLEAAYLPVKNPICLEKYNIQKATFESETNSSKLSLLFIRRKGKNLKNA